MATMTGRKILLAKPGGGKIGGGEEEIIPKIGGGASSLNLNLNLLSDSADFHLDRFLPFLSDNTDFTVVGVIGPPGVGKSTLLNLLYSFHPSSPPGMLPPFPVHSLDTLSNARHCTSGIEPRISSQRFILLDTHPVFSPSVLSDITRPDGSCSLPFLSPDSDLAHQLLAVQLGVLLASVCHIVLVVSEGAHDATMWRLMSTVDLLKHGIPDPSSVTVHSNFGSDKDNKDKLQEGAEEYIATPIFIHTNLGDEDLSPEIYDQMEKVVTQYFRSSSFMSPRRIISGDHNSVPKCAHSTSGGSKMLDLFLVPRRIEHSPECQYESYDSAVWKIRDHVLSMTRPSFSRTLSEREWLKNTAKIWEMVKNSSIILEYCRMLQSSGLFRR